MSNEKRYILKSLLIPAYFIILLWIIKLGEIITHTDLYFLGIYPQHLKGIIGIITAPLIHGDLKQLSANSVPIFVLGGCLFYFYKEIAVRTTILIWLITGLTVWVGARESYHIGASGIVYGLAGFLFFSGIFRRDNRLLAITMLVTFLYGSLVWGIFPEFYPEKNISYESHFWGLVIGSILAFYYRNQGPKPKKYNWEIEEEMENDLNENEQAENSEDSIMVNYTSPDNNRQAP